MKYTATINATFDLDPLCESTSDISHHPAVMQDGFREHLNRFKSDWANNLEVSSVNVSPIQ